MSHPLKPTLGPIILLWNAQKLRPPSRINQTLSKPPSFHRICPHHEISEKGAAIWKTAWSPQSFPVDFRCYVTGRAFRGATSKACESMDWSTIAEKQIWKRLEHVFHGVELRPADWWPRSFPSIVYLQEDLNGSGQALVIPVASGWED